MTVQGHRPDNVMTLLEHNLTELKNIFDKCGIIIHMYSREQAPAYYAAIDALDALDRQEEIKRVKQGFEPTASFGQRLNSLLASGLTAEAIARAAGVSRASVHNWLKNDVTPKPRAWQQLDEVRGAFALLVRHAGFEPEEAGAYMQAPTDASGPFAGKSLADSLSSDPIAVHRHIVADLNLQVVIDPQSAKKF